MRTEVEQIAQYGRATRGVRVMGLKDGDRVVSLAVFNEQTLSNNLKASQASNRPSGVLASQNGHPAHHA